MRIIPPKAATATSTSYSSTKLVQRGRVANGLNAAEVPTKEPPAAVMDKWFTDGLKLPPPPFRDDASPVEPQ